MERLVTLSAPCRQIPRQLRAKSRSGLAALVLWLILLGMARLCHGAPTVSASLSPESFTVDQAATLTITILDGKGDIHPLPEVEGLLFQRRGQSRQHQIINGSLSSSVSTIFQVQATGPGTFTIPPITVSVEGEPLTTAPIRVAVSPAGGAQGPGEGLTPPSADDGTGQMAFLRISPVKAESYSGELLPVEIRAYFRSGLRASLNSHPRINGDGFLLTLAGGEPRQTEEDVDGVAHTVLTWPGTLSAIKEGRQSLRVSVEPTLLIPMAGNGRRSRSGAGDPFFGMDPMADFFNQQPMQEKKIQLISPETTVTVLPLPAQGRPDDFSGAVGRFTFEVKAQPTDVGPGDPITLTMTVQGRGNFDRVQAPPLSTNDAWKSYTPTVRLIPGAAPGQGAKIFEQAIIAKDPATRAIPSLAFSFFDPDKKQYQTLRSAPIPLRVSGAEAPAVTAAAAAAAGRGENGGTGSSGGGKKQGPSPAGDGGSGEGVVPAAPGSDLAPLHRSPGTLHREMTPLLSRTGFQALVLAAVLLLSTATILKFLARRRNGDPRRCSRQAMARLLARRLAEIHTALDRGDTRAFLALSRQAMQEQLGALWQMEAGAITLADLRHRLPADATLVALFGTAETNAYGGCQLNSRELAEYAEKLEAELRRLA